jgi:membrane associated rhomboid family serine protease
MGLISDISIKFRHLDILQKTIAVMVVCFILPFFINTFLFLFNLEEFSVLKFFDVSPDINEIIWKPWSIFTYAFFHADLWHLLGNMVILYISGSVVLNLFGKEKFIKTFVLGIVAGSITYLVSYNIFPAFNNLKSSMIGASAGVMSVFIFLTSYNPDFRIRLLIFDVKIIYIATVLLIIDVIQIPSGNSGGHLAHLGGAFIGFYYQNKISKGEDFAKWILIFYNFIFKGFNKNKTKNYRAYRKKTNFTSINQKEIDTILDKISKSGYDSLSKKEKETLFKAGK